MSIQQFRIGLPNLKLNSKKYVATKIISLEGLSSIFKFILIIFYFCKCSLISKVKTFCVNFQLSFKIYYNICFISNNETFYYY